MSQQTIKEQARRTAREMAEKRRKERERRVIDLAEQVWSPSVSATRQWPRPRRAPVLRCGSRPP